MRVNILCCNSSSRTSASYSVLYSLVLLYTNHPILPPVQSAVHYKESPQLNQASLLKGARWPSQEISIT